MKVKTVTIATDDGPVIINESDFDKDKHRLVWSEANKLFVTNQPEAEAEPEAIEGLPKMPWDK